FLGTRGEVEESSKFHKKDSAVRLETHNKVILLDFGKSWQEKLKFINPDYIWISHAHPDHVFGLKMEKTKIPIFMSKETNDRLPEKKFPLENRQVVKNNFKFGSIKAREIPIGHSSKAPMSGLIIETDEGKIGYFPDVLDIPDKSIVKGLSIYIGDGSSLTKDIVRTIKGKRVGHASMTTQMTLCQGKNK
ncbi:unnamed protein product, partial [marine sediment metagenome]